MKCGQRHIEPRGVTGTAAMLSTILFSSAAESGRVFVVHGFLCSE